MMQRDIGRDLQLQIRMMITLFLLGTLYAGFIVVLWRLGTGVPFIVGIAVVLVAVQFMLSDRMALAAMRAKVVTPEQEPKLHQMIGQLAETAGVPKPKVAVANTQVPNAFATGRSVRSAAIAVTTGLQTLLNDREMEAVLAHEMSHIKHRDVVVMTYASFFAVVASTLMNLFFWMGLFGGFSSRRGNGGGNAMMIAYIVTIVVWILSQLLLAALSRYREYSADRGAAILTGKPADLASALTRISGSIARVPKNDLRKAESMNAFFIFPAIGGGLAGLFSTHPKMTKRIEQLQAIQSAMGQ
jgi:heat shock protein HtpX